MRQDPVTGALMTDEQAAAADASAKEGFFARFEGRLNQVHSRITEREKAAEAEKARLDAIEQKAKLSETGLVDKVAEHLKSREANLVLVTTEQKDRLDRLEKDFGELVNRINGLQPGFFTQTPPPPKVVTEKVPAPPATPVKTPAQIESERQARQRATQQAEADRKAREQEQGGGA